MLLYRPNKYSILQTFLYRPNHYVEPYSNRNIQGYSKEWCKSKINSFAYSELQKHKTVSYLNEL